MDVFTFFKNKGDSVLFAKPGEVFSYSNIGYAMAGLALEKLTNKPYPEAINDLILNPLKLKGSTFDFFKVACNSFSAGHRLNRSNGVVVPLITNLTYPLVQAAGGLFSNIHDLERFALCLMNQGELDGQQFFDKTTIESMHERYARNFTLSDSPYGFLSYPDNAYGYGIFSFNYGNSKFIGNGGSASQMTFFIYEPEKKFALILISNRQMDMLVNSFKKIFEVVLGETENPGAKMELDETESKEVSGIYRLHSLEYSDEAKMEISYKNGHLFIKLPGRDELELVRTGVLEYNFTNPASRFPGEILFEKDKSGTVNYIRYVWRSWQKVK